MTRNCANQSCKISRSWVGIAYDGGSEDLRVDQVSEMSNTSMLVFGLTYEDHLLP